MNNRKVLKALLGSTILSTLFSFVVIALTVFHHYQMQDSLKEIAGKVDRGSNRG
ncbi:hypothetical protein ACQCVK_13170 [Rossellomorea vietnamensis]|uniref:hypothetical protein n=1 Tax=Rossellomorea TaxID=2837508 RepID=UPI001653D1C2|nr:hypothetical protein [Rossellomorea aquimaris]